MSDTFTHSQDSFCLPINMTMSAVGATHRAYLDAAPGSRNVIDAGSVETMDLVGMQLLIAMLGKKTDGHPPRLSAMSDAVAKAFERAGAPLPQTH